VAVVRAGSARHQEPLGLGGHERSVSDSPNRRSRAYRCSDLGQRSSPALCSNPTSSGAPTDLLLRALPSSRTGATYRRELRTSSQRSAQISRTVSDRHMTTASATRPATTRRSSQGQAPVGPSPSRSCSIDSPSSSKAAVESSAAAPPNGGLPTRPASAGTVLAPRSS
jgi:hypothetical protein